MSNEKDDDVGARSVEFLDGVSTLAEQTGLTREGTIRMFGLFGAFLIDEAVADGFERSDARALILSAFEVGLDKASSSEGSPA